MWSVACPTGWHQRGIPHISVHTGIGLTENATITFGSSSQWDCATHCTNFDDNNSCLSFNYAPRGHSSDHPGTSICFLYNSLLPNDCVSTTSFDNMWIWCTRGTVTWSFWETVCIFYSLCDQSKMLQSLQNVRHNQQFVRFTIWLKEFNSPAYDQYPRSFRLGWRSQMTPTIKIMRETGHTLVTTLFILTYELALFMDHLRVVRHILINTFPSTRVLSVK